MKKTAFAFIACTLTSASAGAEPIKLSVDQVAIVYQGLAALDGYDKPVKDGQQEHSIKVFYEFGGGLRLSIARDMTKLREVVTVYQAARQAALASVGAIPLGPDGKPDESSAPARQFGVEDLKMRSDAQEIELDSIKTDELKLDKNPIPASILSFLSPILK